MKEVQRIITFEALEYYDGNRTHTANALGLSRRTIRNWMNEWRRQGFAIIMPKYPALGLDRTKPLDSSVRGPELPNFSLELAKTLCSIDLSDKTDKKEEAETSPSQPLWNARNEQDIIPESSRFVEAPYLASWPASQLPNKLSEESLRKDAQSLKASHLGSDEK